MLYLDNAATTPLFNEIIEESKELLLNFFNPSGKTKESKELKLKIEECRNSFSTFINAPYESVFFTSGATESNNTIIKGFFERALDKNFQCITSNIEHPSVLDTFKYLEKEKGLSVDYLKGNMINLDDIKCYVKKSTKLSSIMYVNNETGAILDIENINEYLKELNIYTHSDLTQALGKIQIDVRKLNLDSASFSGHKIHSLKGTGVIYVKDVNQITPLLHGGGQENNFRSGTENVFGILCLGIAVQKYNKELDNFLAHYKDCKVNLVNCLTDLGVRFKVNFENTVDNIVSIRFFDVKSDVIMAILDSRYNTHVSIGSACSSNDKSKKLSHALLGFGLSEDEVRQTLRISFNINTSKESIKQFSDYIFEIVSMLGIAKN